MEPPTGRRIAWDSSAAIYYLQRVEPYWRLLAQELREYRARGHRIVLSVVSYHEMLVRPWREADHRAVTRILRFCRRPPVELIPVTPDIGRVSARLRAVTRLATPDALIIATARASHCLEIVGNDARWRGLSLGVPYRHLDEAVGRTR